MFLRKFQPLNFCVFPCFNLTQPSDDVLHFFRDHQSELLNYIYCVRTFIKIINSDKKASALRKFCPF